MANLLIDEKISRVFAIREGTKGERVSIGSDGNILRWSATNMDDQGWFIYPAPEKSGWYRILSVKRGEFMGVGSNGNIRLWGRADDGSQLFRFTNLTPDGTFNIEVAKGTGFENVAVGSNGNILRWAPTNGKEQRFSLEVLESVQPKIGLTRPVLVQPGTLPDPAKLNSADENPPATKPVLVSEDLMTAAEISDDKFTNKYSQYKSSPYYLLRRFQYWDYTNQRGWSKRVTSTVDFEEKFTSTVGFSKDQIDSIERTVGHTVNASGTAGVEGGQKAGDEGGKEIMGKGELQLQYQYQKQTTEIKSNSSTIANTKESSSAMKFAQGDYKIIFWKLIDRYELASYNASGGHLGTIRTWEYVNENDTRFTAYPEDAPKPREK